MTKPVSDDMHRLIRARLAEIAEDEGIAVLFAIESGSRAWGFHSPDSDYDVRFVYARPLDWHLSLGKKRDVVERPIDDELDISGWELSKALTLALGSNAVIAEWLQSPVVYEADEHAVSELTDFARAALDRRSVTWHYLSLLRRQRARLIGPDGQTRLKRFFYVLRPALTLRWIRLNDAAMPPMDMARLIEGCALTDDIRTRIDSLTDAKKAASEGATGTTPDPAIVALIDAEVAKTEVWLAATQSPDRTALWERASVLHISLTSRAFP